MCKGNNVFSDVGFKIKEVQFRESVSIQLELSSVDLRPRPSQALLKGRNVERVELEIDIVKGNDPIACIYAHLDVHVDVKSILFYMVSIAILKLSSIVRCSIGEVTSDLNGLL